MNVLIVEDDPSDLKLVRSVLEAEGHDVDVAPDAEAALRSVAARCPHLILTDLALPNMDGLALARHLKGSAAAASVPIIAMTAYTDRFGFREGVRTAGFFALLVKPIDIERLPALVDRATA